MVVGGQQGAYVSKLVIKRKSPQGADDAPAAPAAKPKSRRYILPSGRVAEFLRPKIGQIIEWRREAMIAKSDSDGSFKPMEIGFAAADIALRHLFVGLTEAPVPVLYKPGFDLEGTLARLRADDAAAHESAAASGKRIVTNLDEVLERAEMDAEDVDAMKASANPRRISDLQWDDPEEFPYLHAMQDADPGTPEAADWEAIARLSLELLSPDQQPEMVDPKAPRPKIRPLR